MYDKVLEEAAKIVYESWREFPGWLPWVPNGNSLKQDEARGVAARILRISDLYANEAKENEQSKHPLYPFVTGSTPHPFTIGDAPIRYYSSSSNNEDVCINCGKPKGCHNNDVCPSNTILCSGE